MSAHHFFVEPAAIGSELVTIDDEEGHHAARVLRVRVGEPITVADNSGRVVDALITDVGPPVIAEVRDCSVRTRPRPDVTIAQALSKSDKLDEVVEKAGEIGIAPER